MLVGIYTNKDRDEGLKYTRRLIDALDSCGLDRALHDSVRIKGVKSFGDDCSPRPDVIVVLGGDGSILSAVAFAAVNDIPILGVNTGNVGFLSSCGAEQIEECAERLKRGDYTVATRSMVCTDIGGKRSYALNDIVFCRGNIGKTVRFTVRVNGAVLGIFKADGCIVSTPTGSTAYALSSGGPIIDPSVRCILLVPVCCHHMSMKPVVVDENEIVEIVADEPACVVVDGRVESESERGITVAKAPISTKFVVLEKMDFYVRIHDRLGGNIGER